MWNSLGFVLIQKTASLFLSSAIAPVPTPENEGGGSFLWTILGVLAGLLIGILIYKVFVKSRK